MTEILHMVEVIVRFDNGIEYVATAAREFTGELNLKSDPLGSGLHVRLNLAGYATAKRRRQRPSVAKRLTRG